LKPSRGSHRPAGYNNEMRFSTLSARADSSSPVREAGLPE
jgi:hypothetical protein